MTRRNEMPECGYPIDQADPATLDQKVSLTNPGLTTVVIENLVEGMWYFTLASVNSSGVESQPTGYVSKTIG